MGVGFLDVECESEATTKWYELYSPASHDVEPVIFKKLFVGGLSLNTTDEDLKTYYEQFGKVTNAVVKKDKITGKSRHFGFVTFKRAYSVDDAQNGKPHVIDGRVVATRRAIPRRDFHLPEAGLITKKLFIGGIRESISENDLREVFGIFGKITDVYIPRGQDGEKRKFAFLEFEDEDSVDKAVLIKHFLIGGKRIVVTRAIPRLSERLGALMDLLLGREDGYNGRRFGRNVWDQDYSYMRGKDWSPKDRRLPGREKLAAVLAICRHLGMMENVKLRQASPPLMSPPLARMGLSEIDGCYFF